MTHRAEHFAGAEGDLQLHKLATLARSLRLDLIGRFSHGGVNPGHSLVNVQVGSGLASKFGEAFLHDLARLPASPGGRVRKFEQGNPTIVRWVEYLRVNEGPDDGFPVCGLQSRELPDSVEGSFAILRLTNET
jgi:hypothetical protein